MYPKQQNTNWHHNCDNRCWLCEQIASTEFRNVLYVSRLRPLCHHFQSQSLCSRLSPITVRPLCVRALSRQFVFSAFGSIESIRVYAKIASVNNGEAHQQPGIHIVCWILGDTIFTQPVIASMTDRMTVSHVCVVCVEYDITKGICAVQANNICMLIISSVCSWFREDKAICNKRAVTLLPPRREQENKYCSSVAPEER